MQMIVVAIFGLIENLVKLIVRCLMVGLRMVLSLNFAQMISIVGIRCCIGNEVMSRFGQLFARV